ncbi:MAG: hypothetical protein A2234_07390 [Elusimicrobia bacterium RIFOXYA2_FULL_58_8]|nr:MAG: hypothetical protein A2234_07390 [Elusimicrobia bacterium RIFOXYA2_FULL_58_8]OGS13695.1 MAG: hypothetical protein A2285_01155 [Elusimicrobia bacterium RIFOXYA12_FULL_57_11]
MKARWLNHPLDREISRIAVPAFLGFLDFILFDAINIFWVGRLGTPAITGVASATFLTWAGHGGDEHHHRRRRHLPPARCTNPPGYGAAAINLMPATVNARKMNSARTA